MIHKGNGCSGRLPLPTSTNISNYMSVERIFYYTPFSLPVSESISVGRTRWNTNQCTYIDRVPVSVSEWLLGSFVLILTVFVQLNQYSQILRRQCCLLLIPLLNQVFRNLSTELSESRRRSVFSLRSMTRCLMSHRLAQGGPS